MDLLSLQYEQHRIAPERLCALTHRYVIDCLDALPTSAPGFRMERLGKSYFGREIRVVSVGAGNESVLMWSQMHGDEPTPYRGATRSAGVSDARSYKHSRRVDLESMSTPLHSDVESRWRHRLDSA